MRLKKPTLRNTDPVKNIPEICGNPIIVKSIPDEYEQRIKTNILNRSVFGSIASLIITYKDTQSNNTVITTPASVWMEVFGI